MTTATTIGKAVISDTREPGFEFINEQILKDIFNTTVEKSKRGSFIKVYCVKLTKRLLLFLTMAPKNLCAMIYRLISQCKI